MKQILLRFFKLPNYRTNINYNNGKHLLLSVCALKNGKVLYFMSGIFLTAQTIKPSASLRKGRILFIFVINVSS